MAKAEAVICDTCNRVELPVEDAQLPLDWLQVTVYRQGSGELLSDGTFCTWECVSLAMKGNEPVAKPPRRKRRTREQIEADNAAAAAAVSV